MNIYANPILCEKYTKKENPFQKWWEEWLGIKKYFCHRCKYKKNCYVR